MHPVEWLQTKMSNVRWWQLLRWRMVHVIPDLDYLLCSYIEHRVFTFFTELCVLNVKSATLLPNSTLINHKFYLAILMLRICQIASSNYKYPKWICSQFLLFDQNRTQIMHKTTHRFRTRIFFRCGFEYTFSSAAMYTQWFDWNPKTNETQLNDTICCDCWLKMMWIMIIRG